MKETVDLFVPGRICLFGEHSDWAGTYMTQNSDLLEGQAIVSGINLGIYATALKSDVFKVNSFDENGIIQEFECEMNARELRHYAQQPIFFSYCCGVAAYFRENYHVKGINIVITKVTLPMKKGLSSSAAVCCLVAKAFNELYDLRISTRGIMQIAYRGELLTGSRCGRLDQACAYGESPVLMHFSYSDIEVEKLRVGKTLYWVIADLKAGKDTKKILAHLNKAYPFATCEIEQKVQEALGEDNHRIIEKARMAIEEGNAEKLGAIMREAQTLFDKKIAPACPDELSSPVLHSVIEDEYIQQYIYGAKGVGSQGDGTVQLLVRDRDSQEKVIEYLNNVRKMDAFPFTLNAGGKIRKAIIPIAGFGTRMFPETFFAKKAFLPIVDRNDVVKPVILFILEELVEAEIEEIFIIIGEGEEEDYKRLFHFDYDEEFASRIPEKSRFYYKTIYEIGKKVRFVVQNEKKGFGHAVYQARDYLKKEPVLLMLGDFLYRSNLPLSCTKQTINAYYKSGGKAIVSIKEIMFDDARNYGIVHGKFSLDYPYIMLADDMVEKPSADMARNQLEVDGRCFATFGQYVLTDDVFQYLEKQIEENNKNQVAYTKEIDLTSALRNQAQKGELAGVVVDGISYDVGTPQMYYKTFTTFYSEH